MKSIVRYGKKMAGAVLILLAAGLLTPSYCAENGGDKNANSIKSMLNGINSSNRGLAQSCIFFAGYHKYTWAVEPLIKVLNDPAKETNIRISAAYALFMIGDEKGILAIKSASLYEDNYMVKGTCEFIYNSRSNQKDDVSLIEKD